MGLLDGQIQTIIGDAMGFLMLDATIHQETAETFDPDTGEVTPGTVTSTAVARVGFPDVDIEQYRADALLQADERLLLLLQKPLVDAGLTLKQGDEITMRGVKSRVLRLVEDPAQATLEVVVKP